jgi:Holliday junction resolvasome RuvABC endonuclease subunit
MECLGISLGMNVGLFGSDGRRVALDLNKLRRTMNRGAIFEAIGAKLTKYLQKRRYRYISIEMASYGMNVSAFVAADLHSKLSGVVLAVAASHDITVLELDPSEVSRFATGRTGATPDQYLQAAVSNGGDFSDPVVAKAYWIMCMGQRKANE